MKRAEEMYTPFDDKAITVDRARPAGRHELAAIELQPRDGDVLRLRSGRVLGPLLSNKTVPPGKRGSVADLGSFFVTTGFGYHEGYFTAIDAHTGEIEWQKRWPRVVLLGLGHDRRRARLRRPQQRRPRGVRRRERRGPALELPDRRRREQHRDGLRTGRDAVSGLPRRRQRARSDEARRQPLALLARRHDGRGRCRRRGRGNRPRRPDAHRAHERGRRGGQGRVGRQLRRLPRPRRHGRQRRPEPRRQPERGRPGQGAGTGHERRRRHARLQGHAHAAADHRRRRLREPRTSRRRSN